MQRLWLARRCEVLFGTVEAIAILLIGYKAVLYWVRRQERDLSDHHQKIRDSFRKQDHDT
jgi:hypothetical protein